MPFRHFYLLSHYICNGLLFLFSVCWLHVNEFNSFWEELRGRGQKSTACSEDIFVMEFYLPVLTLHLRWSILFIFCLLAPEGMKPIVFGEIKEENQKSTTCSKGVPSRRKMMIYRHNIVVNLSYTTIAGDIILLV